MSNSMPRLWPAGLIVVATCAAMGPAHAQEVGSVQRGLTLARQICAQCHLVVKEAGRSARDDAPTFETIAKTPGMTAAALSAALQTSHVTMPNVVLSGNDISDIVAYILSLKD